MCLFQKHFWRLTSLFFEKPAEIWSVRKAQFVGDFLNSMFAMDN